MKKTMKRKQQRKADAVLTADLHLTDITPVSRIDDYIAAQERKLAFIADLSAQNDDCPILCAGDVLDYWKASPWLTGWAYSNLPDAIIAIPGNHDLPMHSIGQYQKSALRLLAMTEKIEVLTTPLLLVKQGALEIAGVPYGLEHHIQGLDLKKTENRRILLLHKLVWQGAGPKWGGGKITTARQVLEEHGKNFDLILTGDNHLSFCEELGGSLLVNPGSIMRSTASQLDFEPKVYLYYADTNTAEPVLLPIEKDVMNIDHLTGKKERENRLSAYIERMGEEWEQGMSFRHRLDLFFQENKTPTKIQDIIWRHLEGADRK